MSLLSMLVIVVTIVERRARTDRWSDPDSSPALASPVLALAEQQKDAPASPQCAEEWKVLAASGAVNGKCASLPESHPLYCFHFELGQTCGDKLPFRVRPNNLPRAMALCSGTGNITLGLFTAGSECAARTAQYRMAVLAWLARDKPIARITDKETLEAIYLTTLGRPGGSDRTQLADIGRRLVELAPNDKSAARMWAFGEISRGSRLLPAALEHLEQIDRIDLYLAELKLSAARSNGNTAYLRRAAQGLSPRASAIVGKYYLAWAAFLDKDPKTSVKLLAEIPESGTVNFRARYTRQLIENGLADAAEDELFLSWADDVRFALDVKD